MLGSSDRSRNISIVSVRKVCPQGGKYGKDFLPCWPVSTSAFRRFSETEVSLRSSWHFFGRSCSVRVGRVDGELVTGNLCST